MGPYAAAALDAADGTVDDVLWLLLHLWHPRWENERKEAYWRGWAALSGCSGGGAKARATCAGGASPYTVVRGRGVRPAARMSCRMAAGGSSSPWVAPAARVMLSFMSDLQPQGPGEQGGHLWRGVGG